MSPNFEEKYEDMAKADTPDLWSRIDAGLSARPVSELNTTPLTTAPETCDNAEPTTEVTISEASETTAADTALKPGTVPPKAKRSAKRVWIPIVSVAAGLILTISSVAVMGRMTGLGLAKSSMSGGADYSYTAENGSGYGMNLSAPSASPAEPIAEEYAMSDGGSSTGTVYRGDGSEVTMLSSSGENTVSLNGSQQKLITTLNYTAETLDFDAFVNYISETTASLGGYIESESIEKNWNDLRYGSFTLRIPEKHAEDFDSNLSGNANVTSKTKSVEDVTLEYSDLDTHIQALKTEQERLLEMLAQAESLADMLAIEAQLTNIRYELESYGSQMKYLENKIDYATIYLNIHEVKEATPVEELGFWENIGKGLSASVKEVGENVAEFFSDFIIALPHLIVWSIILNIIPVIGLIIFFGVRKKKRKKREAQQNKAE